MRQRFFTSTAQTRLIKNIIANTPLPIYDTVQPGDYIIKNCKYIYNISLIRCIKSGTLEGSGEFVTLDYSFYWGANKLNHTEKLKDATGFYDSKVHEWLGRYLRAYRDMKGINLMPFYNCFSGVYTSRFTLLPTNFTNNYIDESQHISTVVGTKISVYESIQSYDVYTQGTEDFNNKYVEQSAYKTLQIPIKLNRTYTIAVDCDSTVRIAPAFINHGHLVKVNIGTSEIDLTDTLINNADEQGMISPISLEKTNTTFIKPFTIFINSKNQSIIDGIITEDDIGLTYEQLLQRYEKYLYLLIQLPRNNTSSVVVLEGDYTNVSTRKIFSLEQFNKITANIYENIQTSVGQVILSKVNNNKLISNAPYVASLNIEGLEFNNLGILNSKILSIIPDKDYGSLEYYFNFQKGRLLGDVNLDGRLNSADFGIVNDYIINDGNLSFPLTEEQLQAMDANEDGVIDWDDVTKIIQLSNTYYITTGDTNLHIYSYVPIPEGSEFTVNWCYNEDVSRPQFVENNNIENDNTLLDELLISKLSLLQFNDQKNYPFSDRLIEYLTLNVIDSADEISDNVKYVQNFFGGFNRNDFTYGAWNNYLRIKIYLDTINANKITHLDNIGYVDKTIESLMFKNLQTTNDGTIGIKSDSLTEDELLLKQQELRQHISQNTSVVNQPRMSYKNNVVKDNLLVNPSSNTPVQRLINKDNLSK